METIQVSAEYKTCANGHQYDLRETECPYCPKSADAQEQGQRSVPDSETVVLASEDTSTGETVVDQVQITIQAPAITESAGDSAESKMHVQSVESDISSPNTKPIFAWLIVMQGVQQYEVFRIDQEQTYIGGRSECDIVLQDEFVSSEHASVRYRDGKFFITDLDSSNGTFVNDSNPSVSIDREEIKDGDDVQIGTTLMKFKCI